MQCNVLYNGQHMFEYGQIRGACLIHIRLSGRAYRGRGKLSILEDLRLDPIFSLLTFHYWYFYLCKYWSIFCNLIVVSVLTSSHSSVTITSHVPSSNEKILLIELFIIPSLHILVRESYMWYPFLLFLSLDELIERNDFIFFKRDLFIHNCSSSSVSNNLYLLVNPTLYFYHERPHHYVLDRYIQYSLML